MLILASLNGAFLTVLAVVLLVQALIWVSSREEE